LSHDPTYVSHTWLHPSRSAARPSASFKELFPEKYRVPACIFLLLAAGLLTTAAGRHVTISLCVARHEVGETAALFLQHADEALYNAKANERNRLQVARTGGVEGSSAGAGL
jgi:GGDEF domain-containing protein